MDLTKKTMIQTTTSKPKLSTSLGGTVEKNIPEDVVWIDDAFYIKKTRFGLHTSILKEPYGAHFITGMQYEDVLKNDKMAFDATTSRWCYMKTILEW